MIFNSYSFLLFAIVFFSIFYFLSKRLKIIFLLIASYLFYGWWNPYFLGLILLSTVIDFNVAKNIELSTDEKTRKKLLLLSVIANLGILGFFKYFNFFIDSFLFLFSFLGFTTNEFYLNILLPVGISFYTFQTMAYTIDVYRKQIVAEKDFLTFAVYVCYFPQLVAGPIERADKLLPQIKSKLQPTKQQIKDGVWLVLWGFFLKVVVADNLAKVVDATYESKNIQTVGGTVWIAVLAFSLQIYGDFAGYSKIARGVSKFIGIDLARNFKQPYFALSPSDFWRRWHITLSEWLRDYLYISLGGNRGGSIFTLRNLMITMLLGGLWHGASWVFIFWGFYHGLLLIVYRLTIDKTNFIKNPFTKPFAFLLMFFFTIYGWLIFRAKNADQLVMFSKAFFSFNFDGLNKDQNLVYLFWIIVFFFIVLVQDWIVEKRKDEITLNFNKFYHLIPLSLLIACIYFLGAQQSDFIYFQF